MDRITLDRVLDLWNKGDMSAADAVHADNVKWHHPALPEPLQGREALKQHVSQLRSAFPSMRLTFDDVVMTSDRAAVRWTFTGTQQGEWQGIPASGRRVTAAGVTMVRQESGKIVEEFVMLDMYGFLQQLGVVPAPDQAKAGRA